MTVEDVRNKVQRILTEAAGSVEIDSDGDFVLRNDSAAVFITVEDLEERVIIHVVSYVLLDVPLTPELYEWVATEGKWFFASTQVIREEGATTGIVHLSYSLLGDFLDRDELLSAISAVGTIANDIDDELQARFGGKRYIDATS